MALFGASYRFLLEFWQKNPFHLVYLRHGTASVLRLEAHKRLLTTPTETIKIFMPSGRQVLNGF